MNLSTLTWTEVESYLKTKNSLILPIGSTEQHGPTGLLGTDHLCAEAVSAGVGAKLQMMVAPSVNYGMASRCTKPCWLIFLEVSTPMGFVVSMS